MLGTADNQNQDKKSADTKKAAAAKTPKTAAKDSTAASSTGTVFAPTAGPIADPMVNPYDLTVDSNTQTATNNQTASSAPPVFAESPPAAKPAEAPVTPQPAQATAATPVVSGDQADNLLTIKQQALQNLTPLIDKLEQTPEDNCKSMMMLLQASDNPDLVKNAYEAAQAIPDEKVKAQALLDVVNEINYFTQQQKQ